MCSKYEEISVMYFLSSNVLEMKYITLTPEKTTAWKKVNVRLRLFPCCVEAKQYICELCVGVVDRQSSTCTQRSHIILTSHRLMLAGL